MGIKIKEEIIAWKESTYLISSNRDKCVKLLEASDLDDNDIIDVLISLHMVLEIALNALYRHLSLLSLRKPINKLEVTKNIDNINFIDKTVLFIYNSKFNFDNKTDKATKYHKIIGAMKDFSGIRNKLLHGHTISTVYKGEKKDHSDLKKKINPKYLNEQIKKFCFIMEGMRFYLDCLDSPLTEKGKEAFKREYLSDDFLPHLRVD